MSEEPVMTTYRLRVHVPGIPEGSSVRLVFSSEFGWSAVAETPSGELLTLDMGAVVFLPAEREESK